MLFNARQVHKNNDSTFPPIILLAIENISEVMLLAEQVAEKFAGNVSQREEVMKQRNCVSRSRQPLEEVNIEKTHPET
jgi:hypothetical protein